MGVDLCGGDIGMSQQGLQAAQIRPLFSICVAKECRNTCG